jgi:predicted GNAT superfamily acetyltransferase
MTLIQAQQKYIDRVSACSTSHINRVRGAARRELFAYAEKRGFIAYLVVKDAQDMVNLYALSDD